MSDARPDLDKFTTPMEIAWQYSYEVDSEKLARLYSKSKRFQWDGERDLDWSLTIDPSRPLLDEARFGIGQLPLVKRLPKARQDTLRAHFAAHQLSQFLHGEQGALMTAAALTHAVPDYEGKLYAATQTMDEARHVEVYERYVRRLAIVYPMQEGLKSLIDVVLQADHWVKIAIGMNMVVEGLALGSFHNMRRGTSCELLRTLTSYVLRDESRHVAFGNVYVGKAIAGMHPDDREDIAEFTFHVIAAVYQSPRAQERGGAEPPSDAGFARVLEAAEIDADDFRRAVDDARAQGLEVPYPSDQVHAFRQLMMPALVRVGAVTERSRALYDAAAIPIFEDAAVLEAMEANEGVVN